MNHGRVWAAMPLLLTLFSGIARAKDFPAVPGEYVVKLKSQAMISDRALEKTLGAKIERVISNDLSLVLVKRPSVELQATSMRSLARNPLVAFAEPNYIYSVRQGEKSAPTDPELPKLWALANTGQHVTGDDGEFDATPGIDIAAIAAWQIETGSSQVIVAVIDTGVNYNEPDLAGNIWTNTAELTGMKGVDDDGNGFVDDIHGYDFVKKNGEPMDVFGHGTHCSGIIGARANDDIGIVGIAWNVRIMPVRFLGDDGNGTLADAISAIEYAIKMKANIMNNSWAGEPFAQSLFDVISKARDAGILFVAAAGNEKNDNDANPTYPANYQLDNVISVAAINPNGKISSFSNFGKTTVHVAAPGSDILSHTMNGLQSWSGTSMATPHVSGIAALLMSQDMSQDYLKIKSRILASARPLASLRGRVATAGMVNAYYALSNQTPPADPSDPFNWDKSVQKISSAHPYENGTEKSWTVTVPGAKQIAVYFSKFATENNYDEVEFKDKNGNIAGEISGNLGEVYGPVIDGDTATITFSADSSNTDYGFDIEAIAHH